MRPFLHLCAPAALFGLVLTGLAAMSAPLAAQDAERERGGQLLLGGDLLVTGARVVVDEALPGDLFALGARVLARADLGGAAHMAARVLRSEGRITGNVYAAGMEVSLAGPVGGNATLAGYRVEVTAPVGGNLRATAATMRLAADLAGAALIGGGDVIIEARIGGDATLAAETLTFGPGAAVAGQLVVHHPPGAAPDIPASVAPAGRVTLVPMSDRARPTPPEMISPLRPRGMVAGFLGGVLVIAVLAALVAAVAPEGLSAMRRRLLARPFATLGYGFLALSALIGAGIVAILTIVGILVAPALALLALAGAFVGYVIGAYSFGAGLVIAVGRAEPSSLGQRVIAALVGALSAGLIGLVPFIGWLFILALALAGLGALVLRLFRPALFVEEAP